MKALCAAQCLRSWLRSGNNSGGAALTIATIATAAVLLGQAPDRSAIAAAAPQAEKPRVSYVEAKRGKDSGHATLPATRKPPSGFSPPTSPRAPRSAPRCRRDPIHSQPWD